ncbi:MULTISPECIES: plasmid pRiA4b ORF-3 family protein [Rhizobium]|uniref:Plasmid pRiA4b Orf3-like domain-containing protein n=1 Tax=Rhizobium leguminosarum TaxID=384 RepID=A0A7W7E3Q6_RHILE|nr:MULTISPECIES: plasmid pRiA4b ORF-3 family protein [Rhizobium]MBB4332700.1 hypothetical protein [Rhizobium leguminosarum]MBB4358271.1 hypothetical protein [Rhizobium leguminosarum]MBB4510800.1 hypothetical protein [Rhizobium leguminosarum]MBB4552646.1 hypothetical protein [Rhizobium leguminosarum]MBB4565290.1 hypothetical protein [Rhizobium leguminosarum]
MSIDACTSRQVAARSVPIPAISSSDLLDDLLATLFIPVMFKPANAVQIKVSIDEIQPQVWRRLVLPIDWNLQHLHLGIQAAFNWWNYHLYEFRIGGLRYGDIEVLTEDATDDDPRVFDQTEVRLLDFEEGSVFSYNYDFGDGWRHTVAVEEFLTLAPSPKQGSCIAGERARPPEDVGGVSGYERFLEIIADKEDPEYTETIRWCGGYFDPEWLDLAVVDKDLRNALRSSNGACTNQNPNPCPRNELDEVQDRRLEGI